MTHELKRVWQNQGSSCGPRGWGLYCADCRVVFPVDWIQDPEDPKCPRLTGLPCNQCGTDILTEYRYLGEGYRRAATQLSYGLSTIVTGGYESPKLYDNNQYRFRMCESCLVKLFTDFTVPVDVREYTLGEDWHPATEDDWK